ncbi:MAG: PD40 domain-containing protein [Saprospiraceae bacterium]|nr:PD40 domain-containing protein [Candidatus Defluviibacterium haderslevense]
MKEIKKLFLFSALVFTFNNLIAQPSDSKLAAKYFESKNYSKAQSSYEAELKLLPNDLDIKHRLAICYTHNNEINRALSIYQEILNSDKVDPEIYFEYGELLRSQADFAQAKVYFEKYAQTNPAIGQYFAESCDYALEQLTQSKDCSLANLNKDANPNNQVPIVYNNEIKLGKDQLSQAMVKSAAVDPITIPQLKKSTSSQTSALDEIIKHAVHSKSNLSFSDDGTLVAFTKSNSNSLTELINSSNMTIFFATVDASGNWSDLNAFSQANSNYSYGFPNLSNNGQTLYFASNMPGGMGGYDLYKSEKNADGNWSEAQNLGSLINTPGNEICPFFKKGDLFFSTDWHHGFGGFDVFRTTNRGIVWSDVENLGTCVNSVKDDYNFILDKNNDGLFTSNRDGSKNAEDIYKTSKVALANSRMDQHPIMNGDIGIKSPFEQSISAPELSQKNEDANVIVFDDPNLKISKKNQANKLYFIQITALSNSNEQTIERFKKYAKYGDVYKVMDKEVIKIRLGAFNKLNEAITILNTLKKNGIKDAFIVGDFIDNSRMQVIAKANTATVDQKQQLNTDEEGKFKIRVAEYKAPDWFDSSNLKDLGTIENWTKNGWTIIILGSFQTGFDAAATLDKVKARGYKEAYIVIEEGGKLFRQ